MTPNLAYFDPGDARRIAYCLRAPADPHRPTLLFLPGYASDMEGAKALAVDAFAAATGCGCLRLDYSGTGSSGGKFEDGTLARWLDEVVAAIVDGWLDRAPRRASPPRPRRRAGRNRRRSRLHRLGLYRR